MAAPIETEVLDLNLCTELSSYITSLTTTGNKTLDQKLMKKVKQISRKSDGYVEHVYHLLMTQLRKEHSEIRFSTLLVCDELFLRSHKFRTLLLADFQEFLQLCAETDADEPLPPPKAAASNLKQKTLECVQDWHRKFKDGYKLLVIAYTFLKECKQVNFDDLEALSVAQRTRESEARLHVENIQKERLEKASHELDELVVEIESVHKQLENCFRLLRPHPDVYFEKSDFTENATPSVMNEEEPIAPTSKRESMRLHGMMNRNLTIQVTVDNDPTVAIEENFDTSPVLENIKDFHNQIVCNLQPSLAKLLQVFTKCGCEEKIKKAIDLKQVLESSVEKCGELEIVKSRPSNNNEDSDQDDFEEVEDKEGLEDVIPLNRRKEYGLEPLPSTSSGSGSKPEQWSLKLGCEEVKDPTTRIANISALCLKFSSKEGASSSSSDQNAGRQCKMELKETDERKAELLSKAPKKNFDIDLYHWEDEKLEAPTVVQFDSLHKFWQPRENETTEFLEQEGVAALRRRVIEFSGEFQPVKWTCRAPLPSGKLCPRRDRKKCPFHGPIIPRDCVGNPSGTNSEGPVDKPSTSSAAAKSVPEWQDPDLLREIEAATGVNLKMPEKGKRKKKDPTSNLTNIKVTQNTTRRRLERKVMNKDSVKRVAATLDRLDHKKFRDKYGDQWNYAFNI